MGEAVGSMCHLMASDKLEEQLPRIIPAIVSLYKKNTEHYVISKVGETCPKLSGGCWLAPEYFGGAEVQSFLYYLLASKADSCSI